jgi:ribosomal protein S18 acetylase RimI-like enzyme
VSVEIRLLGAEDCAVLEHIAAEVFDRDVDTKWSAEFLNDPRHHLIVALDESLVVGFASAVHYVHPDKPPELWINEVGIAPSYQRQGVGHQLLDALLKHGSGLGCVQAWVLTSPTNMAAMRLYKGAGGRAAPEPSIMFEFPLVEGPA